MCKNFCYICSNIADLPVIERHVDNSQIIICVSTAIIIILLLIVKLLYHGYYKFLISSVFQNKTSIRNVDDSNIAINQGTALTAIISVLSITTALFACIVYFTPYNLVSGKDPVQIFFIVLLIVLCYAVFYKTSLLMLGWITDKEQVTSEYSRLTSDIFRFIGIILIPLFLVISFSEVWTQNYLIYTMLAIVVLAFCIRLFKFFVAIFKIKFLNHYTILYFCVFEILPVLFVVKIAGSLSDV